ncbi:MAG: oxidoreductase [Sulfurimonas sp.]|jgi:NAD(P)-dependent dehydrogenase (short-subunit alcohol dehydrogenase family)
MLKNKVVVVTGGAGLIGKEFVKTIVEQNGIAIIVDINKTLGEETRKTLSQELGTNNIDFIELDITSKNSLQYCIKYLDEKYGRIDALVNNAYPRNKNFGRDVFDIEYDDFCENLNMNLGGYFLATQQFSQYFYKQGYGNIIVMASIYGVTAPRFEIYKDTNMTNAIEYAAIKGGLLHLIKYFAKYFKGKNIRINAISPGGILDKQPETFLEAYKSNCLNKGMLDTDDLKGTLIYLLSEMSKYVNGQNIIVDDGWCL